MNKVSLNGEQAIALAAKKSDISLASGYPGSPGGGIISLLDKDKPANCSVHWSSNEKIALEKSIGVAIGGNNALVCVKSVGLNAMVDPLTVTNLTPLEGSLVIIVGDDPGAYGSQNDQDSRPLAKFLQLPWLEPVDVQEAFDLTVLAFRLSKWSGLPIFIRITRSLATRTVEIAIKDWPFSKLPNLNLDTVKPRFVPGPKNAVAKNYEHIKRLEKVTEFIENSAINYVAQNSNSQIGLILCGSATFKISEVVDEEELKARVSLMVLNSVYPIPDNSIGPFLQQHDRVLIIEENTDFVSLQFYNTAIKYKARSKFSILVKPGELFRSDIACFLKAEVPGISLKQEHFGNEAQSLRGNCGDCRYGDVLDHIDAVCKEIGLVPHYFGDPGCLVTVVDRLFAKYAMGGSIAQAFGANLQVEDGIINIALVGDSGLFHSALLALIDAIHHNIDLAVVLLNNNAAKTTGGQYHPGVTNDKGTFDYAALFKACGLQHYYGLNLDEPTQQIEAEVNNFIRKSGVRLLQINIP